MKTYFFFKLKKEKYTILTNLLKLPKNLKKRGGYQVAQSTFMKNIQSENLQRKMALAQPTSSVWGKRAAESPTVLPAASSSKARAVKAQSRLPLLPGVT